MMKTLWRRVYSLPGFIFAGYFLVALPLLVAIILAWYSVNQLAEQAEQALSQSFISTKNSQKSLELLQQMERNVRQYLILKDSELLELYLTRSNELLNLLKQARRKPINKKTQSDIVQLTHLANEAEQFILLSNDLKESGLVSRFNDMKQKSLSWLEQTRSVVIENSQQLRTLSFDTQQKLFLLLLTIPLAITLILILAPLLSQSLKKINEAIYELSFGNYEFEIEISGPPDLTKLGFELKNLGHKLKQSEQQQQQFLRHMSHELKTPLASLIEGTELLTDGSVGQLSGVQNEVMRILTLNAQNMRHQIENILDYNAWQSEQVSIELTEFSFKVLFNQEIQRQQLMLASKDITIKVFLHRDFILADRNKMRVVIDNLLSNSIKYCSENSTITIQTELDKDNNFVINFSDDGPNIPKDLQKNIFEPFFMVNNYRKFSDQSHNLKGSGIGLSLVKEYILGHFGTIEIINGQFSGAHFKIVLPQGHKTITSKVNQSQDINKSIATDINNMEFA